MPPYDILTGKHFIQIENHKVMNRVAFLGAPVVLLETSKATGAFLFAIFICPELEGLLIPNPIIVRYALKSNTCS